MGALRVGHAHNDAAPIFDSGVSLRARYVRSDTGPDVQVPSPEAHPALWHRAFVRLCVSRGSISAIAAAWGCSRALVYKIKAGAKQLTTDLVAALPPLLLVRLRRLLLSDERRDPLPDAPPEQLLLPGF